MIVLRMDRLLTWRSVIPEHITWKSPNGVKLERNTIMSSMNAAEKIYYSDITKRNRLTIEIWIVTDSLDQMGHCSHRLILKKSSFIA